MVKQSQIVGLVGVVLCFIPFSAWADCVLDTPYWTSASSQVLDASSAIPVTFVVAARDKALRCSTSGAGDRLSMNRPLGLPPGANFSIGGLLGYTGEVGGVVTIIPNAVPAGIYNVVYTVTDSASNTISVTLPLVIASAPIRVSPLTLDPVSDLAIQNGQTVSFAIAVSDPDGRLNTYDQNTLVIDGLPPSAMKQYTKLTPGRIEILIALHPSVGETGTYRVTITGKKPNPYGNSVAIAQMRLVVY